MATGPADFDAILEALGAADAEPPPLMKKLLEPVSPGLSRADRAALVELEAWLTVLRDETPAT